MPAGLAVVAADDSWTEDVSVTEDQMTVIVNKVVMSRLPRAIRDEARHLLGRLPADAVWVGQRLAEMAEDFAVTAAYADPAGDLMKCVPLAAVHRYMVEPSWRAIDVKAFTAKAEAAADPAVFLRGTHPRSRARPA